MKPNETNYDQNKYAFGELGDIPERIVYSRSNLNENTHFGNHMTEVTKEKDLKQNGDKKTSVQPDGDFKSDEMQLLRSPIQKSQEMRFMEKQYVQQLQSKGTDKIIPPVRLEPKLETSSKPMADIVETGKSDETIIEKSDNVEMQSVEMNEKESDNEGVAMNLETEDTEEETTIVESDTKTPIPVLPFDQHYLLVFFTTVESFGKKVGTSPDIG